jgi:inosine-uridine nucleoside N-ribohydrolase
MTAKILRVIGIGVAVITGGLLTTFVIPVEVWRTGDQGLSMLTYTPGEASSDLSRRLWIDTDAACGYSERTDPDDCFAIALLARVLDGRIVGISSVFGNASGQVVDQTTKELAARLSADIGRMLPVYNGSYSPVERQTSRVLLPAHQALVAALEAGPLTIVALGPLTNLATVLLERPDLRSRIRHVVAVMGRRPGHIFHPAEGADSGILFGHGPVFRDFNFMMDISATVQVVGMNLPLTLIPYDAARGIEITGSDLDRFTTSNGAVSWIADRARLWLGYWQKDIGRQGFYPFDLLAAAYLIAPSHFGCAQVQAWVGQDPTLFIPFWRPTALLVSQNPGRLESALTATSASYCAKVSISLKALVIDRLAS